MVSHIHVYGYFHVLIKSGVEPIPKISDVVSVDDLVDSKSRDVSDAHRDNPPIVRSLFVQSEETSYPKVIMRSF